MSPQPLSDFAEAVIVLANLMDRYGQPNEESSARLELAAALVRERPSACLITSGWDCRPDSKIKIAHAMRDWACDKHGIAPNRIFSDPLARDTVGDAVFVKRNLIEPSAVRTLTIVTSGYHMQRARQIFRFVFGEDYKLAFTGTRVDHARGKQEGEAASLAAFRATFCGLQQGDTDAICRRLIRDHPLYNGTVYPALHIDGLELF